MENEDIMKEARILLASIFGSENISNIIGCVHSKWLSEEHSKGSYSYFKHSVNEWDHHEQTPFEDIASPLNACYEKEFLNDRKVFYAGEATSVMHRGTAHGAYMSGIDAARRVIETF